MAATWVRAVALLRGINIGTSKRVPMADLRQVLTGLGYSDVVMEKIFHGNAERVLGI